MHTRTPRFTKTEQRDGMKKNLLRREFKIGDKVLLYNSRLKLFSGKFKSRWSGPYIVISITPYGAIRVKSSSGEEFNVNEERLKHFVEKHVELVEAIDLKE